MTREREQQGWGIRNKVYVNIYSIQKQQGKGTEKKT